MTLWGPPQGAGAIGYIIKYTGVVVVQGAIREVRIPIALASPVDSTTLIPGGSRVVYCAVKIDTGYSVGTTISVGHSGNVTLLQNTSDNDPQSVGMYVVSDIDELFFATDKLVRVTIAGAPAVGAGVVIVRHSEPQP